MDSQKYFDGVILVCDADSERERSSNKSDGLNHAFYFPFPGIIFSYFFAEAQSPQLTSVSSLVLR